MSKQSEHEKTQEKIDKYFKAVDRLMLKINELLKNRDEEFLNAIERKFGKEILEKYLEKCNA